MTPCKNIRAALDDWLDDRVDAQVKAEIDAHLAECGDCTRFFEHHRELAGDLLALAGAANRIADAPAGKARPRRRLVRTYGAVAAAILLLIGAGLYVTQLGNNDTGSGKSTQKMAELPPVFRIETPAKTLAVPIESTNPRIRIVWLYNETLPPDAPNVDVDDEAPGRPS